MKIVKLLKSSIFYSGFGVGALIVAGSSMLLPSMTPLMGIAGLAAVGVASLTGDFTRKQKPKDVIEEISVPTSVPEGLREQIIELREIGKLHRAPVTPVFEQIANILRDSKELFQRINSKLDSQAHLLAALNYTDTLIKLNHALDKDYYLDIMKNPRLWDNPEARLLAVEKAVEATERQLIRNIQQVNASQDIDYEVSLDSLTNSMSSVSASTLLNEKLT